MYIFYICNMKKKKKIFEGTVLLFDTYKNKRWVKKSALEELRNDLGEQEEVEDIA